MNAIVGYALESVFCGLIAYLIFKLLISRISDYSYQRIYLLTSSLIIFVFPLINIPVSDPLISEYIIDPVHILSSGSGGAQRGLIDLAGFNYYLLFYSGIALVYLAVSILNIKRVLKIKKQSFLVERNHLYSTYITSNLDSPFSFGKSLYIPQIYDGEERDMIIKHEVSHIIRNHTLDIVLVSLINAVQWFNPFVYLIKRKLVEVHEYQADIDVLKCGVNIIKYRELLLLSQFGVAPAISNSFHKSLTFKRFIKMENLKQSKAGISAIALFAAAILLLFSVTSFSKSVIPDNSSGIPAILSDQLFVTQKPDSVKTLPYDMVEVKPKFQGGDGPTKFAKWISENIVYPEKAKKDSVQGRVIVQFVVDEFGKVGSVKILRGLTKETDAEVFRVVSQSPDWEPGVIKGKKAKVQFNLPVAFALK